MGGGTHSAVRSHVCSKQSPAHGRTSQQRVQLLMGGQLAQAPRKRQLPSASNGLTGNSTPRHRQQKCTRLQPTTRGNSHSPVMWAKSGRDNGTHVTEQEKPGHGEQPASAPSSKLAGVPSGRRGRGGRAGDTLFTQALALASQRSSTVFIGGYSSVCPHTSPSCTKPLVSVPLLKTTATPAARMRRVKGAPHSSSPATQGLVGTGGASLTLTHVHKAHRLHSQVPPFSPRPPVYTSLRPSTPPPTVTATSL